ncbi:MAG TPA: class I SAM-dependent methyltransferase [Acidobacteriaceae bacterium]|nr:class I SAM-dependent methyltransferase [Acidobacteriaceae bacterium]
MPDTGSSAPPSPERFFNAVNAFQLTEAMKAALDLGIFTAVAQGNAVPSTIASRVSANERGVRILCDYLTVQGFLSKTDGSYSLPPDSALFLDSNSPAYIGSVVHFLANDRQRENHRQIADAVRRGGCADTQTPLEPNDPVWVVFARQMMPMMRMPAQMIATALAKEAPARKVLDIAAGHGIFGITVAQHNPGAEIYAADWPNVLEVAKENAEQAGVADRHHLIPGSAFETDFGTGYDLALITNFLHHFDRDTCISFLRRVHMALEPGGRAAILEFVPNADRVTPAMPASFSLIMLASTPSGDTYTFSELSSMAQAAGFSRVIPSDAPMGAEQLVIAYK